MRGENQKIGNDITCLEENEEFIFLCSATTSLSVLLHLLCPKSWKKKQGHFTHFTQSQELNLTQSKLASGYEYADSWSHSAAESP